LKARFEIVKMMISQISGGPMVSIVEARSFAPDIGHAQRAPTMPGVFYETIKIFS